MSITCAETGTYLVIVNMGYNCNEGSGDDAVGFIRLQVDGAEKAVTELGLATGQSDNNPYHWSTCTITWVGAINSGDVVNAQWRRDSGDYIRCLVENGAGMRVMGKVGMKHEGVLREYAFQKGAFRDFGVYSMLKRDYEGNRCDENLLANAKRL